MSVAVNNGAISVAKLTEVGHCSPPISSCRLDESFGIVILLQRSVGPGLGTQSLVMHRPRAGSGGQSRNPFGVADRTAGEDHAEIAAAGLALGAVATHAA